MKDFITKEGNHVAVGNYAPLKENFRPSGGSIVKEEDLKIWPPETDMQWANILNALKYLSEQQNRSNVANLMGKALFDVELRIKEST